MKFKNIFILLLLLTAQTAFAQKSSFLPQKLDSTINTPYPEFNPVISPDEKTLYFVRANHPQNTYGTHDSQDIWYSEKKEDGNWTDAKRVPGLNIARYNAIYSISEDGNTALINGRFNKKGNIWKKRGVSIVTKTDSSSWSKPTAVKIKKLAKKNKGLFNTAFLTADGNHLILSYHKRYNSKKSDIFVSRKKKNGRFSAPKKINIVNTITDEEAPFVSADGKKLYFASKITGDHNIYVTDRLDDTWRTWTTPKPISDSVNTTNWESYFKTNKVGSIGYFASNQGSAGADIYVIKLFEERPYILVKGKVISRKNGEPLKANAGFNIFANGTKVDSLVIAEDGSYSAYLPLGQQYELQAKLEHHTNEVAKVDATSMNEYTETSADLYVTPWPYVMVEGNMMSRSTETIIPVSIKPIVLVNGVYPDSASIDHKASRFKLWLPYGKKYSLQIQADGYQPEVYNLDLSKVTAYEEVKRDLWADNIKTAVIAGRIFNKKTGEAFPAEVPLKIIINDTLQASASVDAARKYEMKLPIGNVYTINATAEGYYPMYETVDLSKEEESVKVLKDLYLAPIEVGQSIRLNNIFFATGKAELKPESFPELDRVIKFLQDNPKMKIEIAGHTDNRGSKKLNDKLSADRAKSVAEYIISKGIEKDKITSRGYGSSKPEANNNTEEGRTLNRRVEFTILAIVQ